MQNKLRIVSSIAQIWRARIALLIPTILTLTFAQATFAQNSREQIEGVQNFGRVTERFFRGGQVTPDGIERLAALGVRTIIDLRDEESPGEAETCQRNGIKYFKFPMSGYATPDEKAVNEILSIIERAKEPVYVHCSAGKHRAGTIAARYRIRVQGWSPERAWAEQNSYGFGPPEGHPQLYAYVYGKQFVPAESGNAYVVRPTDTAAVSDEEKSSKKTKKHDDDDDHHSSKEKRKKNHKSLKNEGDDAEDDSAKGKDRSEKAKGEARVERAEVAPAPESKAGSEAKVEPSNSNRAGLSAAASYISLADAIKRARDEGGKGDVLKLDLEWDPARSLTTWDITFSSGNQYELDAASGKLLGTTSKAPAKLAVLAPLALDGSAKRLLTFQEIIRKAEASRRQTVMEMELKQIKGRADTIYEVVLADRATILYDAATGATIEDF